jgi:hypothetical protein
MATFPVRFHSLFTPIFVAQQHKAHHSLSRARGLFKSLNLKLRAGRVHNSIEMDLVSIENATRRKRWMGSLTHQTHLWGRKFSGLPILTGAHLSTFHNRQLRITATRWNTELLLSSSPPPTNQKCASGTTCESCSSAKPQEYYPKSKPTN